MKVCIVAVLVFAVSAIGEDVCERSPFNVCDIPHFKVPENIEDLNYLCPNLINYIECLGNYSIVCHGKPESTIAFPYGNDEYESVRDLISDICGEEPNIHAAVFENIRCLKDNFFSHNGTCYDLKDEALDGLNNATRSQQDEEALYPIKSCISRFYDMSCFLYSVAENCAHMARTAALNIIHRSYFLRNACKLEMKSHVLNHFEEMEFNSSLNANFRDAFVDMYYVGYPN